MIRVVDLPTTRADTSVPRATGATAAALATAECLAASADPAARRIGGHAVRELRPLVA